MLFNSIEFIVFLLFSFIIYWKLAKNLKIQNIFLLIISYIFYGWWDWRFLALIFASTVVDFLCGNFIQQSVKPKLRKVTLYISLAFNIGLLFTFKYFNFFIESFTEILNSLGLQSNNYSLNLILPVGISFYTFQTLSYTIDVYNKKLKATKSFIQFACFVSFFPQLVAGPIERAKHLLPQFSVKRKFSYEQAVLGSRQIIWGFLKKMVIADNISMIVDEVYLNYNDMSFAMIAYGLFLFSIQIYCDFSGYSDIAIGTSKLFGFNLMQNFKFPYFASSISEFWRRWHISLTTWFRDYIYFPLGGSKNGLYQTIKNTILVFLISGIWHGANWTFIIWGSINALLFIPSIIFPLKIISSKFMKSITSIWTFILVTFTWIFFRSENIDKATSLIQKLFNEIHRFGLIKLYNKIYWDWSFTTLTIVILFMFTEWIGRKNNFALEKMFTNKWLRWFTYSIIISVIFLFAETKKDSFIYFQF